MGGNCGKEQGPYQPSGASGEAVVDFGQSYGHVQWVATDDSNLQNLGEESDGECQKFPSTFPSRQTYPGVPGRYGHAAYHPGFAPPGALTRSCRGAIK